MLTAAKWALGIVPAGFALGAVLGAAVDPDMKDAPAPWWRLTGTEQVAAAELDPDYWPQDLAAGRNYRPDLDYDAEVWTLPIPAYELMIVIDEPAAEPLAIDQDVVAAEEVADEAEAAAEDVLAAEAAEPELAPGEVRKSELGQAGLY